MSSSRSPWRYPLEALTLAGTAPHPFAGLPLELVGQLITDDPTDQAGIGGIIQYFNHFARWEGPVAEGAAGGWILSGTTGAATVVLTNTRKGEIALTADATASTNPTLQLGSATLGANFSYVVGKRTWVFARLKATVVATQEILFGLATPDTSPTVTGTFPADGIFFEKALTATAFDFHARKDGTSTERLLITPTVLADDTYTTIGFQVSKEGHIRPYQNGAYIAAGLIAAGTANIPVAAADVLQFVIANFGASQVLTLDWLLLAQEV